MYCDQNFIVCSKGSYWKYISIHPGQHETIIWANDNLVYWCIYASFVHDEFIKIFHEYLMWYHGPVLLTEIS